MRAIDLSETDIERFWTKVVKTDSCWLWTANKSPRGYGMFTLNNDEFGAHRVAWTIAKGPIPAGLHICHDCDNPPCVNPDHLFPGTHKDNMLDMIRKGRSQLRPNPGGRMQLAKLDWEKVEAIRKEWAAGGVKTSALARKYGVRSGAIRRVILCETWRLP